MRKGELLVHGHPGHDYIIGEPGKFQGERQAVRLAYEASLDGCGEEFGSVGEVPTFHCRIDLGKPIGVVCFYVTNDGFVIECSERDFEAELDAYEAMDDDDAEGESDDDE